MVTFLTPLSARCTYKGSVGHAFAVHIHTENENQASIAPAGPHKVSGLIDRALGHLRYHLTNVPPQPNSPPDNVLHSVWRCTHTALRPSGACACACTGRAHACAVAAHAYACNCTAARFRCPVPGLRARQPTGKASKTATRRIIRTTRIDLIARNKVDLRAKSTLLRAIRSVEWCDLSFLFFVCCDIEAWPSPTL